MPSPKEILEHLKRIPYPGFSRDIVSFGLVEDVEVGGAGVTITLAPTTKDQAAIAGIQRAITSSLEELGVAPVSFEITAPPTGGIAAERGKTPIPGVRSVIAVASGKGGVGKSTVAANLTLALHAAGSRVGLLDTDIYGPSVPTVLGVTERPRADAQKRIEPVRRHGIPLISMGLFVEPTKAILWRGPMVTKTIVEFSRNVNWGELDYLVLDLPPGTGDAQLTICQQVPVTAGVIVTTPQDVALLDVKRGLTMFKDAGVPVLGVVDNMSWHICPCCGERSEPFGHGGSGALAADLGLPLLASLPLVRELRESADAGLPLVLAQPDHPQSQSFATLAERVVEGVSRLETRAPAHIH